MYCSNCGKEIKEDSIFCQYCREKNIEDLFQNKPIYNTIPIWKIIILYLISFGFYPIVWTFNLWKQAQKKYSKKINPFWRSVFCPITNFELFPLINEYISNAQNVGNETIDQNNANTFMDNIKVKPFHSLGFATIFIVFNAISRILDKINSYRESYTALDLFSAISLIAILSIIVVIQVKINKVNQICNIPAKNDKWTWKTTGFTALLLLAFIAYVFSISHKDFQIAEDAGYIKGVELANTSILEDYCSVTGYVPHSYIGKFKEQYQKTILNANNILDKYTTKSELDEIVSEIYQSGIDTLENDFINIHSQYGISKQRYCQLFDEESDTILSEKLQLLKQQRPNMYKD